MYMIWLFAVTYYEMWLLVSDWLATPALELHLINSEASHVFSKIKQNYVQMCQKGPSATLIVDKEQF